MLLLAALIAAASQRPPVPPVPVAGRVVRVVGADTLAVAGARVVLHRVTVQASGPVDSMASDDRGRFHFRVTPDSGVVYLVSARWSGIAYFAAPLVVRAGVPVEPMTVLVSDVSTTAPFTLAARHLIVSPVRGDGTRDVVDLFVLDNPGTRTRISGDSLKPTWTTRLPHFAVEIHGGNSEFSLESLELHGDSLALFAAIPPGQRDVEIDYQIPPNTTRFEIPVDADAASSNIVSLEKTMRVLGSFTRSDTVIGDKSYARWVGSLHAGQPVVLVFVGGGMPGWVMPAMIAAMVLVLAGVTVWATRSGARAPFPPA